MIRTSIALVVLGSVLTPARAEPPVAEPTAAEVSAFMLALARYVHDHHLKRDEKSPQRGMVYEYFDVKRQGQFDQWVQGEALDTMHDGAWLAAALARTHRTTREPLYHDFLARWQLPFYARVLNHSDTLFAPQRDDSD